MNIRILNRDFQHPADGWYQIEAIGTHPNARANLVQIIDAEACEAMAAAFNREAAAPGFAGMLIDHEHFKHDEDKETIAYGWLMQLQNGADGLYGKIRWSGTGQKAVDDGDYRFFSTEYDPADMVVLNKGKKPKQVRPMKLDGLTLTNVNNNKGQKPITNRNMNAKLTADELRELFGDDAPVDKILNGDFVGHEFHGNQYGGGGGGGASGANRASKISQSANEASKEAEGSNDAGDHEIAAMAHNHAAAVHEKLGHADTAARHREIAAQHTAKARSMRGDTSPHNREFPTALGSPDHQQETNQNITMKKVLALLGLSADASEEAACAAVTKIINRNTELQNGQVEADLETYKNRFDPKQREFIKSLLVTNREKTVEFLKDQPELKTEKAPERVHNRNAAQPVDKDVGGNADTDTDNRAKINDAITALRAADPKLSYTKARDLVRNRQPGLFGIKPK
jgi:hypothetical protein